MVKRSTLLLGLVGALAVGIGARRYGQDSQTPRVDYQTVAHVGDVEIRRYPPTVLVETVAPSEGTAFRRLFRYISGANRSSTAVSTTAPVASAGESISMTAPVESATESRSESVSMTAPVESDDADEGVRMAFYLPAEYDYDTAPRPTDESVRLVEQPGRTLAVLGFSWFTTDGRVARKSDDLLANLAEAGDEMQVIGDPFLMRYDGPGVPPFLRTNEVAVEVRRTTGN
jgi:hypothetical protein